MSHIDLVLATTGADTQPRNGISSTRPTPDEFIYPPGRKSQVRRDVAHREVDQATLPYVVHDVLWVRDRRPRQQRHTVMVPRSGRRGQGCCRFAEHSEALSAIYRSGGSDVGAPTLRPVDLGCPECWSRLWSSYCRSRSRARSRSIGRPRVVLVVAMRPVHERAEPVRDVQRRFVLPK
jgi:hypothetical protein